MQRNSTCAHSGRKTDLQYLWKKTHAGSQQTGPGFDDRIVLSADKLYERFGRENGADILAPYFSRIFWESYKDSLLVPDAEPLISYILSCHGNQNQYLLDKYKDFRGFVSRKTKDGFFITKDAGIFLCEK